MTSDPGTIVCRRRGLFSKIYFISLGERELGSIDFRDAKNGLIEIEGKSYQACWTSSGNWTFEADSQIIASAERVQAAPSKFHITFGDRQWVVEAGALNRLSHEICEQGGRVGRINAKLGFFSQTLVADAPFLDEPEILSFVMWLIGIHWIGISGLSGALSAQS